MSRPKPSVEKALRQALSPKSALLIAVSGGADSCALLHGTHALSTSLELRLAVAHVNYKRRPNADRDEAFVRTLCGHYQIPLHCFTPANELEAGSNFEAWARRQRYQFFGELLDEHQLEWVLTAHTADDAAETLLMRLLSNKEPYGIEERDLKRRCLRPLLEVSRAEVLRYIDNNGLSFVEDETNADTAFLRNRIRHRLLPLLAAEYDPSIAEVLAQRGRALAADLEFLNVQARAGWHDEQQFGSTAWLKELRAQFASLPAVLSWRLAEYVMKGKLGFNIGRKHAQRVIEFIQGNGARIELPGGIAMLRKGGGLVIEKT